MGTLWIPGAERLPCSLAGGEITSNAEPRAVWHTIEGQSGSSSAWSSAIKTLNTKKAEPHVLYDPSTDRIGQFIPLNLSARALKNDGATRTNRVGKVCIQIEVLAFSAKPFTGYWKPGPNWRALWAALRSHGIPDIQPAGPFPVFIASPPHNVPENDRDRATWLTKGGHYSHSQIPGNDHGDPGGVSFTAMLAAASTKPPVTTPEDDMPLTEAEWTRLGKLVYDKNYEYGGDLWADPTGTGTKFIANTKAQLAALTSQVAGLTAAVKALAEAKGVDTAAVVAAVDKAAKEALADLKITLSTDGGSQP